MGFSISNAFKVPPEGFRASWCWFKGGELEALRGVGGLSACGFVKGCTKATDYL